MALKENHVYRIAQFGGFDLLSMGDTMFPVIFKKEMERRFGENVKVDLYSPKGTKKPYNNLPEVYGLDKLEERHNEVPYDCMVLGGGEFIHFLPIEYTSIDGEKNAYAAGELWQTPQQLAEKLGIPVLWNSVGVARNFLKKQEIDIVQEACKKLAYISVRDEFSKMRMEYMAGVQGVQEVPDTLWLFNRYFTKEKLEQKKKQLSTQYRFLENDYLVLQYGTGYKCLELAEDVKMLAEKHGLQVVLLTINYCHEDQDIIDQIKQHYPQFHALNTQLQPEEVMSIIAGAKYFLGTSLHGNLTAMSYNVKCLCLDMYPSFVSKMDGLFAMLEKDELVVRDLNMLSQQFDWLVDQEISEEIAEKVEQFKTTLDEHFDKIAELIVNKRGDCYKISNKIEQKYTLIKAVLSSDDETRTSIKLQKTDSIKIVFDINRANIYSGVIYNDSPLKLLGMKAHIGDKALRVRYKNALVQKTDGILFEKQCEFDLYVDEMRLSEKVTIEIEAQMDISEQIAEECAKEKLLQLERKCEELARDNNNKAGHIEQLLESERHYEREISELEHNSVNYMQSIVELQQENARLEQLNTTNEKRIEQLIQAEYEYKQNIQTLEQIIRNKEGHIELLLEVEREYEREKNSKTYKLALKFRKISVALLPVNSKRRFFVRMLVKALRHPIRTLKMINLRRIKNCFTILRTEGAESAQQHYRLVEEYENSRSVPLANENLRVIEVAEESKKIEDYEKITFPTWENPEVSIVIPVYNQFDYTYHCLESIRNNSQDATYEIILANDCSTDLTSRIEEVVQGINVVNNKKNLRFLLNCNNAAKCAKGKYILFLNNDTQVQDNWLMPLIELMERDATIGMVGSKLIYSDGYLQEAGGILWKDASAWNYGNRQNPNDSEFSYVREVDYISGAAIMIRESLWKKIGGFDERFVPAYCEDSDLAFEVRKHGYKVVLQPKSVVVHFEGISNGTDVTSGQKKYQVDNQKKFYDKWKDELEANHFENGTNVFLARERSKNQRHVLVIDHYVPQYDKDAGSKTTFMYLKMLVNKGYRITFLGDNFYQHEPYTSELQQMGILVLYGPKYAENWKQWLEENIQYFDVFYLNRPHISVKYIDFIKERARGKIIYYGHDLHFLRLKREYEISGEKRLLKESDEWLEKELYLMKRADMNYYPSEIEVEEIHKIDPSIPVKAITAYVFEEFNEVKYDMNDRKGLLFVGGFAHGPNLDAVLWFLDNIYPEVYRRTGAPFYIVGSKAPEEITNIKAEGVVVKGFVSEEELQELYRKCRIAIVPLRYGAGVKGKVVEALYYGIPIVTTSVGAEGISGIEECALVKDDTQELTEGICELYDDKDYLSKLSVNSQKYVREYFSVNAVWNIVKQEFE